MGRFVGRFVGQFVGRRKSRTGRRERRGHQPVEAEAQAVNAQPRPGRVPIGAGKVVVQDKGPTGAIGGYYRVAVCSYACGWCASACKCARPRDGGGEGGSPSYVLRSPSLIRSTEQSVEGCQNGVQNGANGAASGQGKTLERQAKAGDGDNGGMGIRGLVGYELHLIGDEAEATEKTTNKN